MQKMFHYCLGTILLQTTCLLSILIESILTDKPLIILCIYLQFTYTFYLSLLRSQLIQTLFEAHIVYDFNTMILLSQSTARATAPDAKKIKNSSTNW